MNWKGHAIQVFVTVGLPLLGALGAWSAFRWRGWDRFLGRRWPLVAVALYLLTRVGTAVVAHGLLRRDWGPDLEGTWVPFARAVVRGDPGGAPMANLYGPVFPYLLAGGYALGGGRIPYLANLPFLVADALSLVLVHRIARRRLDLPLARRITLAVLLSPILWHEVVLSCQDEVLVLLVLLGVLDLLERGRGTQAAILAGVGTACTKALLPFWALPLLLAPADGARRTLGRCAVAALAAAALMGACLLLGWDPAAQAGRTPLLSGGSSWRLLFPSGAVPRPLLQAGIALAALGTAGAALAALRRFPGEGLADRAARGVVAVQGAFLLLSPFSMAAYVLQGLSFQAWHLARSGAASPKPSLPARGLLLGFLAVQVIPIAWTSDRWGSAPLLVAAWSAFWALAARAAWALPSAGNPRPDPRPDP